MKFSENASQASRFVCTSNSGSTIYNGGRSPRSFGKGVLEHWLCLYRGAEEGLIIEKVTLES